MSQPVIMNYVDRRPRSRVVSVAIGGEITTSERPWEKRPARARLYVSRQALAVK